MSTGDGAKAAVVALGVGGVVFSEGWAPANVCLHRQRRSEKREKQQRNKKRRLS